ncbi:MAG: hypothetical protein ACJASQ_003017 [Crocinitomicaceae bacterium]|jgi:hypothetical protein
MQLQNLPSNQRVFTTTDVVKNQASIFYIIIDPDGDIQVTGNENLTDQNAMVISIQQLLDIDATLANVNIEPNSRLFRATVALDWGPF